jgi:abortive infection bacteriophage resistance protein
MADYAEVGRTAYQLGRDHGPNAYLYATRLSKQAEAEGKTDESAFWKAVAESLKLRD